MAMFSSKNNNGNIIISYRGEMVNLANVIYAKPQADNCIKLFVLGSAGAGRSDSYSVQHREINIYWPENVWKTLCEKAGVIFADEYDDNKDSNG